MPACHQHSHVRNAGWGRLHGCAGYPVRVPLYLGYPDGATHSDALEVLLVRDLANGQEVNSIFVVRSHSQRQRRDGESFIKLQLGDVTGSVEAVVWDEVNVSLRSARAAP